MTGKKCQTLVEVGRHEYVDLTESQAESFCVNEKIGCGEYACAYTKADAPDRIVKFTRDPHDVIAFQMADGIGSPKLWKPPRHLGVTGGGWDSPVWALEVDRVDELEWKDRFFARQLVNPLKFEAAKNQDRAETRLAAVEQEFTRMRQECADTQNMPDPLSNSKHNYSWAEVDAFKEDQKPFCRAFVSNLQKPVLALWKRGINVFDLHSGNIGRNPRTGEYVILDLGHYAVENAEAKAAAIDHLDGRRRKPKRKKSRRLRR